MIAKTLALAAILVGLAAPALADNCAIAMQNLNSMDGATKAIADGRVRGYGAALQAATASGFYRGILLSLPALCSNPQMRLTIEAEVSARLGELDAVVRRAGRGKR